MFTGLVQATARVAELRADSAGMRLALTAPPGWAPPSAGESVAVNGCCLTALAAGRLEFDLSPETLARTNLGFLSGGSPVNVERALRAGEAVGGHFMAGHVDGLAVLLAAEPQGEGALWRLAAPLDLARFVASKGSVALDGVSLTPFDVRGAEFSVALIPHTLRSTGLGSRAPGDRLNFEADLLARYVARLLEGPAA